MILHIACNIDSKFVPHCAVTLVSLFENNKGEKFAVHIVTGGLPQADREILDRIVSGYGHQVCFYTPSPELLSGLSIKKFGKRISMATYYRCFLSDLLPKDIDRLLYLDCDIVCLGDVRPLWDLPLNGVGVAAVEDMGAGEASRYEVLQYPMSESYFNAGVLFINLDYWRKHDVSHACVEYYRKYPERILFNDQDLLNSVLHDSKILVDLKWNVQDAFYRTPRERDDAWEKKFSHVLRHPVLLHFTNRKPWDYDSQHPLRHIYFKYLDLTPWQGQRVLHNPLMRLKRFFRLLPFYVHLRRPKYIKL